MHTDDCTRCGRNIVEVHPAAWMVVECYAPIIDASPDRSVMCAGCMLDLGEFMVPGLADDPEWIAGKDQVQAQIRDIKR